MHKIKTSALRRHALYIAILLSLIACGVVVKKDHRQLGDKGDNNQVTPTPHVPTPDEKELSVSFSLGSSSDVIAKSTILRAYGVVEGCTTKPIELQVLDSAISAFVDKSCKSTKVKVTSAALKVPGLAGSSIFFTDLPVKIGNDMQALVLTGNTIKKSDIPVDAALRLVRNNRFLEASLSYTPNEFCTGATLAMTDKDNLLITLKGSFPASALTSQDSHLYFEELTPANAPTTATWKVTIRDLLANQDLKLNGDVSWDVDEQKNTCAVKLLTHSDEISIVDKTANGDKCAFDASELCTGTSISYCTQPRLANLVIPFSCQSSECLFTTSQTVPDFTKGPVLTSASCYQRK